MQLARAQTSARTKTALRVLVVDDDPLLRRAIGRMLGSMTYEVETAEDGLQAMEALRNARFDLVLSDIAMPEMGGLSLLSSIRDHDPELPVLLMTGHPSVETAVEAVRNGAASYIVKPFQQETLASELDRVLRMSRVARLRNQAAEIAALDTPSPVGLEESFESALSKLRIVHQPIVDWKARQVFAYEALMRSDEPRLPHPGALLDVAERLGRQHDLGRAVRRLVAQDFSPGGDAKLFVNLDPIDLLDDTLYDPHSALSKMADRVVLELTERARLEQIPEATSRVQALRKLGFRIAVDDMGSGYGGLSSLALLEPDVVKLDMFLVHGIEQSPKRQAVIDSLVNLCKELDIRVVAEGIETAAQRDALAAAGCDFMQGYLFAKPGPGFPVPVFDQAAPSGTK